MKIRGAVLADTGVVADLICALLTELDSKPIDHASAARFHQRAVSMISDGSVTAFLAFDGIRAIGLATIHACSAIYAGRFGEISELYVAPEYRNRGIGRSLIDACVEHAKALQWTRLEVGTPELPKWERTLGFYVSNGFSTVGARMKRQTELG